MIGLGGRRGLLHCYVREHFLMTARERADVVAKLVECAKSGGFEVGKVFLEHVESVPEAYGSLLEAAKAKDVVAVLIPSLRHLDGIGEPEVVANRLAASARVQVLVLPQPSFSQGPALSTPVCESSTQIRPFPRSPGVVRTSSGHHTGTPSKAGEQVHSHRTVSCSPFHLGQPRCTPGGACLGAPRAWSDPPERRGGREVPAPGANRTPRLREVLAAFPAPAFVPPCNGKFRRPIAYRVYVASHTTIAGTS